MDMRSLAGFQLVMIDAEARKWFAMLKNDNEAEQARQLVAWFVQGTQGGPISDPDEAARTFQRLSLNARQSVWNFAECFLRGVDNAVSRLTAANELAAAEA